MCVLPTNVTSLCQPMDQGVLESLIVHYHQKSLTVLISGMDDSESITDTLKKVVILHVVMLVSKAWDGIKPLTLVRSWRKLLDHKANEQLTRETWRRKSDCRACKTPA